MSDYQEQCVYARVYTRDNICDGLERGKWQHRLLLVPEEGRVYLVEAMWVPGPGDDDEWYQCYSHTDHDIVDPKAFAEALKDDPNFYTGKTHPEYLAWALRGVLLPGHVVEDGDD